MVQSEMLFFLGPSELFGADHASKRYRATSLVSGYDHSLAAEKIVMLLQNKCSVGRVLST